MKRTSDGPSYGVDVSRNFDHQWYSCDRMESGFSPIYAGETPGSEQETRFIQNAMTHHMKSLKAYVSIRRDGHGILYPYGYSGAVPTHSRLTKVAGDIAEKVNLRLGGIKNFVNDSIFNANGFAHCGHSVDYAFDAGVGLAYEMRVFQESDNRMISQFQKQPTGYERSLRAGYLTGLKELYKAVIDKNHGVVFK